MRSKLIIILSVFYIAAAFSQKKPLAISDFANWNRIENRQISNNGKYIAYELNKQKGDAKLIIYSLENKKSDTIALAYNPQFSPLSDYIVFNIKIAEDTLRRLKLAETKKEKMPKESMGILELANGKITEYPKTKSFKLSEEHNNWLAYMTEIVKAVADTTTNTNTEEKKKDKKDKSSKEQYELNISQPLKNIKYSFAIADTFVVSKKGQKIAFITKPNDSTKLNHLLVFDVIKQKTDTLLSDSVSIKKITFDEKAEQLAFLLSKDTAKNKTYSLYFSNLNKPFVRKVADTLTAALPKNWSPSEHGKVFFSQDGSKLFFGTAQRPKPFKKDSVLEEDKPKLDLWSHTDTQIQPKQLKELAEKQKQSYLALYRIKENVCIQLADTIYENIELTELKNGEVALGINSQPYVRELTWSSREKNDYIIVDLKNGKKTSLINGKNTVSLSPTGKYALLFNFKDNNYYSINTKTGTKLMVSSQIKQPLADELNDIPSDPKPYGVAGWTENDTHILIYDRFDVWKVDPLGKESTINITKGNNTNNRYRYIQLDKELDYINSKEPQLFSIFNEKSNVETYCWMSVSKPDNKKNSIEGDFMLGSVLKSRNSNQLIWSKQTVSDFPEIQSSDLNFNNTIQVSNSNPQQKDFIWPTVEMVEWKSFAGDTLKGLLYKPDNFDPARKYPMMVYFYERNSENLHRYNYPQPSRSIISIPFYTSNEYLVFVPDIVYTTGFPGQNAYDAIVSGVQYLTNTCTFVNDKSIGLQGQSWGGYQVAYLITKTNLFAAAMAGAPVSNMTSAYGGIRWGTGLSRMFQYEETQSRIGGTLWDKPLNYIENSPLFSAPKIQTPLLIMANDNDGSVPWYQGIEFFMALYRLQKPVWMINYNGMEHNLELKYWANRVDLSTRMFGFFNHYLKGMPAPEWMKTGIPAIEKGKNLKY